MAASKWFALFAELRGKLSFVHWGAILFYLNQCFVGLPQMSCGLDLLRLIWAALLGDIPASLELSPRVYLL
jgi:hypothetical protein